MKILVLMGGTSPEREVSLSSGEAIYQSCLNSGFETDKLILDNDILKHVSQLKKCDIVFNALHGGQGENGIIQGFLDSISVRYTGSGTLASAICMDKNLSKKLVRLADHNTAEWKCINPIANRDVLDWDIYPAVVKPNNLGSTIGLSIVNSANDLPTAIREAGKYSKEVIIEEFVGSRELTIAILGDSVLPILEIIPSHEFYDYECKYTYGKSVYNCPARISKKLSTALQSTAGHIFKILKCTHYARMDFRLDIDNQFWFLEANTLPGMTATSLVPKAALAANITFDELIKQIILLANNE